MKFNGLLKRQLCKQLRRNNVTLLEVLIALALIAIALPLLITPFIYATENIREEFKLAKIENISLLSISNLLINFQTKKIPLAVLESNEQFTAPFEWFQTQFNEDEFQVTYTFGKKSQNRKGENKKRNELWQVDFAIDQGQATEKEKKTMHFIYDFIVQRPGEPSDAAAPQAASPGGQHEKT